MQYLVLVFIASWLSVSAVVANEGRSKARLCIERAVQNGSLNISPMVLRLRLPATGRVLADKRFDDAGSLCAELPRGRYILSVQFAKPWTRSLPLHWWTRTFPIDLRNGDASYVMANPSKNDEFQAMIAGRDGWHRLWSLRRVR